MMLTVNTNCSISLYGFTRSVFAEGHKVLGTELLNIARRLILYAEGLSDHVCLLP